MTSRALEVLERAGLPALAFLISFAYWPGTIGAVYTPRWAIMSLVAAVIFFRPIRFTAAHMMGALFIAWSFLTFFWSASPEDTVGAGYKLLMVAAVFCAGSQQIALRPVYAAMAIGLGISSIVAVAQMLGWNGVIDNATPSGLFGNRNFYAEICALVLVALVAERMLWFTLPVLPGLILTGTRGAWLATLVALALMFVPHLKGRAPKLLLAVASAAVAAFIIFVPAHADGFDTMTVRLHYWAHVLNHLSLFGQGAGSFESTIPWLGEQRWEHPHNEFLEIAYETGACGLAIFLVFAAVIASRLKAGLSEALVLMALLVESLVSFPLHNPATVFVGALAAGFAARRLPVVFDPALSGREPARAREQGA